MILLTFEEITLIRNALNMWRLDYEQLVYAGMPLKEANKELLVLEDLLKKLVTDQ